MKKILLLAFVLGNILPVNAQYNPGECTGAVRLCMGTYHDSTNYYFPNSNTQLPASTCLASTGSPMWFSFQIETSGTLEFTITPDSADDINFSLFDVTGHTCGDIATGVAPEVRCNYAINPGTATGINTGYTGTSADSTGNPILAPLQVTAGQTYKLLMDNRTLRGGFTISFTNSTCTFVDASNRRPFAYRNDTLNLNNIGWQNNYLFVDFNASVYTTTSTIFNPNDFIIDGATGWQINYAGPDGNQEAISFSSMNINDTSFNLIILANTVEDNCGHYYAYNDTVHITVIPPVLTAGFGYNQHGNDIRILDHSILADTIYYSLFDSSTTTTTYYYTPSPIIPLIPGDRYQLCQTVKHLNQIKDTCIPLSLVIWPTVMSEQDCPGALNICGPVIYHATSYRGGGANLGELPYNTCLTSNENNSAWYAFTINSPGVLQFSITPISQDDYDFALFDMTGHTCVDIADDSLLEVRCNYTAGIGQPTGIDSAGTGTASNAGGPAFNSSLNVSAGQQFRLVVNNFTVSRYGFTLDFSRSTCTFVNPALSSFFNEYTNITVPAGTNEILLNCRGFIDCNSVDTTGGNFTLIAPPGIHISGARPVGSCDSLAASVHAVNVSFDSVLQPYTTVDLILPVNGMRDYCGNGNTVADTLHISVGPYIIPGFTYTLTGDTVYVHDSSTYADTVYYYLVDTSIHKSSSTPTYYYSRNPDIILPHPGYYQICQVVKNTHDSAVYCSSIFGYLTGISSVDVENNITLFPNPTTGKVRVTLPAANTTTYLELYNVLGMRLGEKQIPAGATSAEMDLANLPGGAYLLRIKQGDGQYLRKVVKY